VDEVKLLDILSLILPSTSAFVFLGFEDQRVGKNKQEGSKTSFDGYHSRVPLPQP
jgi:hypothetical protein